MIPVTDEVFNNLEWETLDGMTVDALIAGAEIVGAEPTDYPLTDGLTIYIKSKSGELCALDIGYDPYTEEELELSFYIRLAKIPKPKRARELKTLGEETGRPLPHREGSLEDLGARATGSSLRGRGQHDRRN